LLLASLGQIWQAGVAVDWERFAETGRTRIALPSYPFQRQRHWIDPPEDRGADKAAAPGPAGAKTEDVDRWFYLPSWTRSPPRQIELVIERGIAAPHSVAADVWLLLLDDHGIGEAIAERLRRQQIQVITVRRGSAYTQTGPAAYCVRSGQVAEFDTLIDALAS